MNLLERIMKDMERMKKIERRKKFVQEHLSQLVDFYMENQPKVGYVSIFVDEQYQPGTMSFQEVKPKRLTSFKPLFLEQHPSEKHGKTVFIQFLWVDDKTKDEVKYNVPFVEVKHITKDLIGWNDSTGESGMIMI